MYQSVVVGFDGTDRSKKAVSRAAALVDSLGARLHLVTVVQSDKIESFGHGGDAKHMSGTERACYDQEMQAPELIGSLATVQVTYNATVGDVVKGLVSEAERLGADLIVVGNKNVKGKARILGNVAGGVIRLAECAVLIENTDA